MTSDVYKTCRAIVANCIDNGNSVIDINELIHKALILADFSTMEDSEKNAIIARSYITITLNQAGYRAPFRREGFFVNVEEGKKEYVEAVVNNAKVDAKTYTRIYESLLEVLNKRFRTAEIDGQMEFDFDSGEYVEQITKEDILEMLRAEATRTLSEQIEEEQKQDSQASEEEVSS